MSDATAPRARPDTQDAAPAPAGRATSAPSGSPARSAGAGVPDEVPRERAPTIPLNAARREAAIRAYEDIPTLRHAARTIGCSDVALRKLRDRDPEFAERLREAESAQVDRVYEGATALVEEEIAAYRAGVPLLEDGIVPKTGEVVQLRKARPYPRDAVRTALNRADPRWTQPKQELEVTTFESVLDALQPLPGEARVIEDAEIRPAGAPDTGHEALPPPTTLPEGETT